MNLARLKPGQIVELEWIDSCTNPGWQSEKDILQWAAEDAGTIHRSIGYLLAVNDQVVVMTSAWVEYANGYRSVWGGDSVPVVAIRSARVLK